MQKAKQNRKQKTLTKVITVYLGMFLSPMLALELLNVMMAMYWPLASSVSCPLLGMENMPKEGVQRARWESGNTGERPLSLPVSTP